MTFTRSYSDEGFQQQSPEAGQGTVCLLCTCISRSSLSCLSRALPLLTGLPHSRLPPSCLLEPLVELLAFLCSPGPSAQACHHPRWVGPTHQLHQKKKKALQICLQSDLKEAVPSIQVSFLVALACIKLTKTNQRRGSAGSPPLSFTHFPQVGMGRKAPKAPAARTGTVTPGRCHCRLCPCLDGEMSKCGNRAMNRPCREITTPRSPRRQ